MLIIKMWCIRKQKIFFGRLEFCNKKNLKYKNDINAISQVPLNRIKKFKAAATTLDVHNLRVWQERKKNSKFYYI
jgi:hypothetical protein